VLSRTLVHGDGPVLLVPVPTSPNARRRRGDAPLAVLARAAAEGFGRHEVACGDVLRLRRRVADQAGLSAHDRRVNLEHAMEVEPGWEGVVAGAGCVLVDDVLTTGATLVEARRALLAGGASEVVAATICATERRSHGPRGTLGRGPGTRSRDRDLRPLS
jgi:predicted amidophosphoribosyltransferase